MIITTDSQQRVIDMFFIIAKETPDIKKISLQMIADRLGIRRESIYKYCFRTPEEILERAHYLIDIKIEVAVTNFIESSNHNVNIFLTDKMLPILYEHREWLQIFYSTTLDPQWGVFLEKKYSPLIKKYLDKIKKDHFIPNKFLSLLILKQFSSIISVWLKAPNPEPVSIFKKKFLIVFKTPPYDFLNQL